MELQLDFSQFLPQHLTPSYDKVVTMLTQEVKDFPRGSALLTRERKGVFGIKIWDKTRGEKLLGKKVEFYYEGAKSQKKVTVEIEEKARNLRYQNPKYITMVGFERYQAQNISNDQMDKILANFGDIIVPTQDVFADVFLTGKKKARFDLNKGKDIPRDLFVEVIDPETNRVSKATIRCFYRDQPYFCKRCSENHVGDCPEWVKDKIENERVTKLKKEETKCVMIGDSNFRCINQRGVMANVTSISGAKIGHIVNQMKFTDFAGMDSVVLSAGQNCLNDVEEVRKDTWENRTNEEINNLSCAINDLTSQNKTVYILDIPPTPNATSSKTKKEGRRFINSKLAAMVQAKNKKKAGSVAFIEDNDGNFNPSTDFEDDKHLTTIAVERLISKIDNILPGAKKLKKAMLKEQPTCAPYRGCYGTYPIGCYFCTKQGHNELSCPKAKQGKIKRNRSEGSADMESAEKQVKTT